MCGNWADNKNMFFNSKNKIRVTSESTLKSLTSQGRRSSISSLHPGRSAQEALMAEWTRVFFSQGSC